MVAVAVEVATLSGFVQLQQAGWKHFSLRRKYKEKVKDPLALNSSNASLSCFPETQVGFPTK